MNHALSIIIIIMIITIIIITIIIIIVAAIPIVDKRGIVTVSLIYSILSSCRLKFTAQRDLTSERTQHMLEMMAEPHRWQLARLEHGQKDRCIISSTCLLTITFYTQISRTFSFSLLYYCPLLTFLFCFLPSMPLSTLLSCLLSCFLPSFLLYYCPLSSYFLSSSFSFFHFFLFLFLSSLTFLLLFSSFLSFFPSLTFLLFSGTVAQVQTPATVRARELLDLYKALSTPLTNLTEVDARLDVLLHVKVRTSHRTYIVLTVQ